MVDVEMTGLPSDENTADLLDETEDWSLDAEIPERAEEENGLVRTVKMHRRKLVFLLGFVVLFFLITISVSLSLTFALSASSQGHENSHNNPSTTKLPMGVVIDLGSSGSRISVYGWNDQGLLQPFPASGPPFFYSFVRGGIASAKPPSSAGDQLIPLLDYAARAVVSMDLSLTQCALLVYGTGGLRSIDQETRTEIMQSVADTVAQYPFYLPENWLGVLTGQEEAAFDWVSVQQYLLVMEESGDPFVWDGYDNVSSAGCLDMGGSSVEVAFASERPANPADYVPGSFIDVLFHGATYELYAISYPDIGHNEVFRQHQQYLLRDTFGEGETPTGVPVPDPCLLEDCRFGGIDSTMLYGTGNVTQCLINIHEIINWTATCDYETHCSWDGIYQPPVDNLPFIAFSEFADVALFFGFEGQVPLREFYQATVHYCLMNWHDARSEYSHGGLSEIAMAKYCFEGLYIYSFFIGMGFPADSTQISFHEYMLSGIELNWGLGMMTHFMEANRVHLA